MSGPSSSDKAFQRNIASQQQDVANQENQRSQTLFNLTEPGLNTSEDFYSKIASGDPTAIARAMLPGTEQIAAQSDAAKERIRTEMPRGGEQRLAIENADISKASAIGRTATGAYASSFPALASLAGTGIGLSANEVANALAGFKGAGDTTNTIMTNDAATKAATMGMVGQMAQGAGTAAAGFCWIAEVLYGVDDDRTHLLRYWLKHIWGVRGLPRIAMWAYRRYGRRVAAFLRAVPAAQAAFRPIFDAGVRRAQDWQKEMLAAAGRAA